MQQRFCYCGREEKPNIISQIASLHSSHTWLKVWTVSCLALTHQFSRCIFNPQNHLDLKTHRVCQTYRPCVKNNSCYNNSFNLIDVMDTNAWQQGLQNQLEKKKYQQCNLRFLVLELMSSLVKEWTDPCHTLAPWKCPLSITEKPLKVSFFFTLPLHDLPLCTYSKAIYIYMHDQLLTE